MKISIIGAGNVGSLCALRIAQENLGQVTLVDIVKGMAQGKALDMEDARSVLANNYSIEGTDDFSRVKGSDIVVATAGLPRKPGMTREELLAKNSQILKEVCLNIKNYSPDCVLLIVTNPLDLMTNYALKITGFKPSRLFGMGVTLDASRFANLISSQLNVPVTDVTACVIGSHGESMLPLPRFTTVKGVSLDKLMDKVQVAELVRRTVLRGQEIVNLLGSGSAFFAPSAAVAQIVRAIAKDEKRVLGVSAYLNGEYGAKGICLGVPCRIGKAGIEQVIELELTREEKDSFLKSAESVRALFEKLPL